MNFLKLKIQDPRHKTHHRLYFPLLALLIALAAGMPHLRAQLEPLYFDEGMVGLGLALRTLPTTGAAPSPTDKVPSFTNTVVEPHKSYQLVHQITVPANAPFTQPYWFRKSKSSNRYEVTDATQEGQPFAAPLFTVSAAYSPAENAQAGSVILETPIQYRWYDPSSAKERRMKVDVVPALSLSMNPELLVVPLEAAAGRRFISVNVHNNVPGAATARISLNRASRR